MAYSPVRAARGNTKTAKGWIQEAAKRMLMNNLDAEVAEKPEELDDLIIQMIESPKPVIFDCRVSKLANCFPMIPSGEAHNSMIFGDESANEDISFEVSDAGKMMV